MFAAAHRLLVAIVSVGVIADDKSGGAVRLLQAQTRVAYEWPFVLTTASQSRALRLRPNMSRARWTRNNDADHRRATLEEHAALGGKSFIKYSETEIVQKATLDKEQISKHVELLKKTIGALTSALVPQERRVWRFEENIREVL